MLDKHQLPPIFNGTLIFLKPLFLLGERAIPHLIEFFEGHSPPPPLLKGWGVTVLELYKLLGFEMNYSFL